MTSVPPGGGPPDQGSSNWPPSQPPTGGGYPPPPPASPYPLMPQGWYSGPFPPPGLTPQREGLWSALLRAGLKTFVVTACLSIGIFAAILAIGGCAAAISGLGDDADPDALKTEFAYGDRDSSNHLLSLRVDGVILGQDPGTTDLFGLGQAATYGYTIKEQFRRAANDDSIDGVVLELSTPGGTIFGSEAIADGVRLYQQATGKPVLAFVDGLSASGGMWSMAPADRILADNGSLVGSIGIIMGPFEYYDGPIATEGGILGGGITTRNGISVDYLTAGRGKDVGNPFRKMTDEERSTLQRGLDSLYSRFVDHVSEYRDIPAQQVRDQLGALIYSNADAEALHLIDGTANRQQAYAELAKLAKIDGSDWKVVRVKSGSGLSALFSKADSPGQSAAVQAAIDARAAELCFAPNTSLVYYGDPGLLCRR